MIQVDREQLEAVLDYPSLIPHIREAFTRSYNFPHKKLHHYPNPAEGVDSTLLLMPAWDDGQNLGVKIITVSPNNSKYNLPSIQGTYTLYDLKTGTPKAMMEARTLTGKRTAATSAMASQMLSREDAKVLLMIGTGALSTELIRAHATIRPIEKVFIWGRNFHKAQQVAARLAKERFTVAPIQDIDDIIHEADIISCATLSAKPLLFGRHLRPGQHYDLVGAYKPDMREADDSFIRNVQLYVDTYEGSIGETGDLAVPLKEGTITIDHLKSDLFELCKNQKEGRKNKDEVTCFKSVGHALEDLAAASLVFNSINNSQS